MNDKDDMTVHSFLESVTWPLGIGSSFPAKCLHKKILNICCFFSIWRYVFIILCVLFWPNHNHCHWTHLISWMIWIKNICPWMFCMHSLTLLGSCLQFSSWWLLMVWSGDGWVLVPKLYRSTEDKTSFLNSLSSNIILVVSFLALWTKSDKYYE